MLQPVAVKRFESIGEQLNAPQGADLGSAVGRKLFFLWGDRQTARWDERARGQNDLAESPKGILGKLFMDDSILECSQMECFNWPEALTGLTIRD